MKIKKHTLFTAASLIVILASGFITFTLLSELNSVSDSYLEEKEGLRKETLHADRLEGVDHERVLQTTEDLKDIFSNPNRPINNILFLEEVIENNNLEGNVTTGKRVTDSNPWPYLEFNVRLEGDFADILNFINESRSGEKLLTIEDLSVEAKEDEEKNREVVANLLVKAYFLDN